MKNLRIPLHILSVAIFVAATACSKSKSDAKTGETVSSTEAVEAAQTQATIDAQKVIETDSGTMQHESAILDIRAREHMLREAGAESAADAYIQMVEQLTGLETLPE